MNERAAPSHPILLIPARMRAARLPGKPLKDIGGKPMIIHVWERAMAAKLGPVYVAAADKEIADAVEKAGGQAVLTDPDLPTGSDRIYQALLKIDGKRSYDAVINVQGDEPLQDPENIRAAFLLLQKTGADIATCVTQIQDETRLTASQVVKVALEFDAQKKGGRALYFSREKIPSGAGPYYHHIGLYAYRREALEHFVKQPSGVLEKRESLEQLRALALGLHIEAAVVNGEACGVDTPEDLERVRALYEKSRKGL